MSPSISELSPAPYVGLRPEDAALFDLHEGEEMQLTLNGAEYLLPVKCLSKLPAGVGVLPAGLPMLQGIDLPAWGSIKPERHGETDTIKATTEALRHRESK